MKDADLLEALVGLPSPTGLEAAAVEFLRNEARRDGFQVLADPVGNIVVQAGQGPRLLLFVGHIDTVPGHITVRVQDGVLWGRGAVDAKGPLVAAYCAARSFLHHPDISIRIVGAIDEEGNSRGAKALAADLRPEWIIIGEPSGASGLTLGYKGILRGAFRLARPHHHGAHAGPTAVEEAIGLWQAIATRFAFTDTFDGLQGHLTGIATEADGLHDVVTASFNVRVPPTVDLAGLEADVAAMLHAAGGELLVDERVLPALADKRTPLVAAFLRTLRGMGQAPRLLRKTGTADFNLLAHRHPGVPIVAYGPGDSALDHTPQERVDLREFAQSVAVLTQVFAAFATLPTAASGDAQALSLASPTP